MKRALKAWIQGMLVVGLAMSAGCSGPIDEPLSGLQQGLDSTKWYFWDYHANFPYAFYGDCNPGTNSCTSNQASCTGGGLAEYSNQGQQVYKGGPFNGYDLDWSHGAWIGGAEIRLPVDAQFMDAVPLTVSCAANPSTTGTEWIPRFRALDSTGAATGVPFLFNHLRHPGSGTNGLIVPGHKYNAGTLVGHEGGAGCNEGNGYWNGRRISDGDHGCVVSDPKFGSPCGLFRPGYVPKSTCHYENGSTANPISACATVTVTIQQGAGTVQVFRNSQLIGQTSSTQNFSFKMSDSFTFSAAGSGGQTFQKFCDDLACTITTSQNPFSGTITASSGFMRAYFQ